MFEVLFTQGHEHPVSNQLGAHYAAPGLTKNFKDFMLIDYLLGECRALWGKREHSPRARNFPKGGVHMYVSYIMSYLTDLGQALLLL